MANLIITVFFVVPIVAWVVIGNRVERRRNEAEANEGEAGRSWYQRHRRALLTVYAAVMVIGPVFWMSGLFGFVSNEDPDVWQWVKILGFVSVNVWFLSIAAGFGWLVTWAARRRIRRMGDAGREPILLDGRRLRIARRFWVGVFVATVVVSVLYLFPLWTEANQVVFVPFDGEIGIGDTDFWSMSPGMAVALTGQEVVPGWYPWLIVIRQAIATAGALWLGWFIYSRKSRHWMALFVSLFAVVSSLVTLGAPSSERWVGVVGELASAVGGLIQLLGFVMIGALFFVFPDGRFRGMYAKFALSVGVAIIVLNVVPYFRGSDWGYYVAVFLVVVGVGGAAAAQVFRYREASLGQRREAREILAGLLLLLLWIVPGEALYDVFQTSGWGTFVWQQVYVTLYLATPLLIGLGVLYLVRRQGWWDMKLFWSRSAVVGMLMPVLAIGYLAILLLITASSALVFGESSRAIAILIATTAVAVVYRPLQAAFQDWVDRRWFPTRARGRDALTAFTDGIRDEVGGATVRDRLMDAVDGALAPASVGMWLPERGGGNIVTALVRWINADPQPDGRLLWLARGLWLVLVAMSTILLVMSLGPTWQEATSIGFSVDYFGAPGHYRLTPRQLTALNDIGLTPSWHGALVVSRHIVLFGGSVLVAWIVWRSNRGWAAVFVSWFLISMMPISSAEVLEFGILSVVVMTFFFTSLVGMLFVLPDGRHIRLFGLIALTGLMAFVVGVAIFDAFWYVGASAMLVALSLGVIVLIAQRVRTKDPTRRAVLSLTGAFVLTFIPLMMFSDGLSGITGFGRAGGELVQRILTESLFFAMPLMFGVGLVYLIVKHGLWDLEVAVNRTVVYGTLTTVLFAVYFVVVAVAQAISSQTFGFRDNTLALVLATAAGAALFFPLRERLQGAVDRVFFRKRYDLERTVEGFDGRIRSRERIDQMGGDLVTAAEEAFQPVAAELWLPISTGGATP